MRLLHFLILALCSTYAFGRNNLSLTPPMGWMSWEIFRCNLQTPTDDCTDPKTTACISEALYKGITDALVSGDFVDAGYGSVHMDDCWEETNPPRDPSTKQLRADFKRFPSGMKALGQYIHSKGLQFATYTAESTLTCGGYPASKGFEELDAKTFAEWGVDYIKVDGCGDDAYYKTGYPLMGRVLEESGRDIVYSCSWPAYICGGNESCQPFSTFINIGCNLWRNWDDIQCEWGSLSSIIDHWGDWGTVLQPYAAPGHWHDADMLLIGNDCISYDEEKTQMAIWSIIASPLIMGNDPRNISAKSKALLLNKEIIAVNQDPMGQMGLRLSSSSADPQQVWFRLLADGSVAAALYNKAGIQPAIPVGPCPGMAWAQTTGGYQEACGGAAGNIGTFSGLTVKQAQDWCCSNKFCAGFSFSLSDGSGYYKGNQMCGLVKNSGYVGYSKPGQIPTPDGNAANITINFSDVNLFGPVLVRDLFAQKDVGVFKNSYTAINVSYHGVAFLKLTSQ